MDMLNKYWRASDLVKKLVSSIYVVFSLFFVQENM